MAETARYRIGPLTTYADPAELRRGFARAKAGEVLVYAIGPALGANAQAPQVARALAEGGAGVLCQERDGAGFRYMIRKAVAQVQAVRADAGAALAALASAEQRLLALLTACAGAGLPCPSNEDLAEQLGLRDRYAAKYRLSVLVGAGLIAIENSPRRFGARIITIIATGEKTR